MNLKELSIINFKNYSQADILLSDKINLFLGNNGEGKTNILDAISYLSNCKSYFNSIDTQNIKYDESMFMIQGLFDIQSKEEKIHCAIQKGKKKVFKRGKKDYSKLSEHIGLIPSVMITPYDINLLYEGSEIRRKFMDFIISQFDKNYLNSLINYNKALNQRNILLKSFAKQNYFDYDSIEIWDLQLIQYGSIIHHQREEFIQEFIPYFFKFYSFISNKKDNVQIEYYSQLKSEDMEKLLQDTLKKDRALQYTSSGVHKDDLIFNIDHNLIKKFGSQGQQKSYLIALKLAMYEFIKNKIGERPILLLDDIYDKLDGERVNKLMELISEDSFGQVFITDTDTERLPKIFNQKGIPHKAYHIFEGNIAKMN